jgi:hypothetical protein
MRKCPPLGPFSYLRTSKPEKRGAAPAERASGGGGCGKWDKPAFGWELEPFVTFWFYFGQWLLEGKSGKQCEKQAMAMAMRPGILIGGGQRDIHSRAFFAKNVFTGVEHRPSSISAGRGAASTIQTTCGRQSSKSGGQHPAPRASNNARL